MIADAHQSIPDPPEKTQPQTHRVHRRRIRPRDLLKSFYHALGFILVSWLIGAIGFHWIGRMGWFEAFENASLILSGMGPVSSPPDKSGKVFLAAYCMYSGLFFFVVIAAVIDKMMENPDEHRRQ